MPPSLSATTTHARSPFPAPRTPVSHNAFDQALGAAKHGDACQAVESLSAILGGDPLAFHEAFLSLLDSASSGMRQRLASEAQRQCKLFTLNAHNREGKTALDLAVRHNDMEFADYLLRHGATPERISLAGATDDMQALVTKWRRKNLLYANLDKKEWTGIDHALNDGRDEKVNAILDATGAVSLKNHAELWDLAMKNGRHDILRAMLLLRPDAMQKLAKNMQQVGQWLNQVRGDPGLSAALKEFPYKSAGRGAPINLNCDVPFRGDTTRTIDCIHLATYHQDMQAQDPKNKIKFDYRRLGNADAIADNVGLEIAQTYHKLKAQATVTHLVDNTKFGQFLAGQFQEMEGEDKPATRLMLIESTTHTMNLGLMVKEKEGKPSYVVKLYDPNDTTNHTRSKADSVQTFETQAIGDYFATAGRLKSYYPEAKGLSMIWVRANAAGETGTSPASDSSAGRKLTTCIDIEDVDATAVWHFMNGNFSANLTELRQRLPAMSVAQRFELLAGRDAAAQDPALFMGMQDGHAEAVKEYCELVLQAGLSEQQVFELLEGKCAAEAPSFYVAMQNGHAEAVHAYGQGVKSLPPDEQADLLLAKVSSGPYAGDTGFDVAMAEEHFSAANAQLQLLVELAPKLSENKRGELKEELSCYAESLKDVDFSPHRILEWRELQGTLSKLKNMVC